MKQEYLIGAAVGVVIGVIIAKKMSAPDSSPPMPTRPTNRPQQRNLPPVVSGFNYDPRRPLIGWRPWGYTTYPMHV